MAFQRKNKAAPVSPWRPDFRNSDELPDTKVVRTDFILNVVSLCIIAVIFSGLCYLEYSFYSLSGLSEVQEEQLNLNRSINQENLRISGEFARSSRMLEQLIAFREKTIQASPVWADLAAATPAGIQLSEAAFQTISVRSGRTESFIHQLSLAGIIREEPEQPATLQISEYQLSMGELPSLKSFVTGVTLSQFTRNEATGLFQFTILVNLNLSGETAK